MFEIKQKTILPDGLIRLVIQQKEPYTWYEREIEAPEGATDEDLIALVIEQVRDELNPGDAINKLKKKNSDLIKELESLRDELKQQLVQMTALKVSLEATQKVLMSSTLEKLPDEQPENGGVDDLLANLPEEAPDEEGADK